MPPRRSDTFELLMSARAFINEAYAQPLDLEQIAGRAGFSRFHFLRLFRSTFEQTPHQFLVERRIEGAKALLAAGELSITEVCFAVGFQSPGSFSALFHRAAGFPPSVYRARLFGGVTLPRRFVPACFLGLLRGAIAA